jgi:hypothetical protein
MKITRRLLAVFIISLAIIPEAFAATSTIDQRTHVSVSSQIKWGKMDYV